MYIPRTAKRRRTTVLFLLPSLIGITVFCLLPIGASIFFSVMDYDLLRPWSDMEFVGFQNFKRILTGREFPQVVAHTFSYLGMYLPLILFTSVTQALILNKKFRGHRFFRTVCYTPVITSWVAAAVVWTWVLSGKYGLLNQLLANLGITGPAWLSSTKWAMPGIVIAAVWKDTGYYALMVLAALKSIDPTYYEAASMDGASGLKKLTAITLPLISPDAVFAYRHQHHLRPAGVRFRAHHDRRRPRRRDHGVPGAYLQVRLRAVQDGAGQRLFVHPVCADSPLYRRAILAAKEVGEL